MTKSAKTSAKPETAAGKVRRGGKKSDGDSKLALQAKILEYTQNADLMKALEAFRVMRERIRKPLTCEALLITLRELDKLASTDADRIAILEQSVQRSWQGVFPLHEVSGQRSPGQKSWHQIAEEELQQALREAAERDAAKARGKAV